MHRNRFLIASIISFALVLLCASGLSGATYYVNTAAAAGGDGTTSDLTGAHCAWDTIADVNAATFAAGNSVLLARGCTWAEQLKPHDGGSVGSVITYGAYGSGAAPKLTGSGSYVLDTNTKSYLTFQQIDFTAKWVYVNASTGVTFNYCQMRNSDGNGLYANNSPAVVCNNCNISGNTTRGVYASGATTTVALNNCTIVGNSPSTTYNGITGASSAHITYTNCHIVGNNAWPTVEIGAGCTDGGNNQVQTGVPVFTSYKNGSSVFVLCHDDDLEAGFFDSLMSSVYDLYPTVRVTFFMSELVAKSTADWTRFAGYAAKGHAVELHAYSHSDLTLSTLFTMTTTNTNPVINLNRTTKTLTLTSDTAGNNVTVDWSVTDKTIQSVVTAVVGKGWTATAASNVSVSTRLSSMTDSGGNKTSFPYAVTSDVTAGNGYPYWDDELVDGVALMTSKGLTPTTLAYPIGPNNATLRGYVKDTVGLIGARAVTNVTQFLSSINIFATDCVGTSASSFKGDGTETTIRKTARHWFVHGQMTGMVHILNTHTSSDLSVAQVGYFVDELVKLGATFLTFPQFIAAIKADHATADNLTYTKTYADISDYTLQSTSPCINAGTDVGLTEDYAGNPIIGAPDIGAYEYQEEEEEDEDTLILPAIKKVIKKTTKNVIKR